MRRAAILSFLIVSALGAFAARAGDAETIDAINKAAAALDAAFEKDDAGAIKQLMTPDHIAVTPYYDGPQSVADQTSSLPDLDYGQKIVGDIWSHSLAPTPPCAASPPIEGEVQGAPNSAAGLH